MWPSRSDVAYVREKAVKYRRYAPLCEPTVAAKLHETALVLEVIVADLDALAEHSERRAKPRG